ncbi:MAG: amidohydrolase family protein [Chitinophagaceae bacterium]|nr:amidohydrolase family protein [Chitinophagaceae bacterium]MDP1763338.1 amidohydrolase family protein [Sediminibacterium sp.]MDP1812140.1 amidohydrolase family protein [Sediminibacterium sp.]MDP3127058.1 amidohydrolase family protein [Sediminibacterium sp.]MDP3665362.1 amidohydrolase family protein [Sediminibacterium sp.]
MTTIIDTHLHTWDLQKLDYYWLEKDHSILSRSYYVEEIQAGLQKSGVTKAVLIQATNLLAETDWLLQLAATHPFISGAVVWLPLQQPEEVSRLLEKYSGNVYFKGVRHQIHDEQDDRWLLQPTVIESLQLLEKENIPYDLVGIKPSHIDTAIELAEIIPSLKMVFDHLNQPPYSDKTKWIQWAGRMKEAALHPNLYAKVSGLGTAAGTGNTWNAAAIKPAIETTLELFGSNRIFCGGDWPVSLLAGTYSFTWQQYFTVFAELVNEADRNLIYGKNAEQFYNLIPA